MSIYTIGDLHLSFHENKPMSIFGDNWEKHEEKIKVDWESKVKENDLVVLPGDFSWSTYLKDTYLDFEYLNKLPGKKLMLKGNHDYWWTTVTSMKKFLDEKEFKNIEFLYNNAYLYENYIFCGTRGWSFTESEEDIKLLKREASRLELSIKEGIKLKEQEENKDKEVIVFMHYPPITNNQLINNELNDFLRIMIKYNIKECYYGHLHSTSIKEAVEGEHFGIKLKLVSADGLNFKLLKIR
ncbi:MAG: metallophosphoesterase [Clostridia bacterium]|nr:metallophosphoesterase [Clostridia bacterium]